MESFKQKPSSARLFLLCISLLIYTILFVPFSGYSTQKKFFQSDFDIDMSVGNWNLNLPEEENSPHIHSGLYLGGYFSSRSRIFSYFFNSQNIYTIYETGIALNRIDDTDSYVLSVPLFMDFAYRVRIVKRLYFQPLLGFGFSAIYGEIYEEEDRPEFHLYPLLKSGFEIRYMIWENTHIKFKFDFGVLFANTVPGGTLPFMKFKSPIPFIP